LDLLSEIVALISAIAAGVIVWLLTTKLQETRLQRELGADFSDLAGNWNGVHMSKTPEGQSVLSRHSYAIKVSSSGRVKGVCSELSVDPPYQYAISGAVRNGGIFLVGDIRTTPSYTWLFNLFDQDAIRGFIFSQDFEGKPFACFIMLSRNKIRDEDHFAALEQERKILHSRKIIN